jgi:hypothetical protein
MNESKTIWAKMLERQKGGKTHLYTSTSKTPRAPWRVAEEVFFEMNEVLACIFLGVFKSSPEVRG